MKEVLEYLLRYLNFRHMKRFGTRVPPGFEGKMDEALIQKSQTYEAEKTMFGFVSSIFGNIVTVAFLFGGILDRYNSLMVSMNIPFVLAGVIYFLILSYASIFLSLPFNLYSTFRIENKHGFNTMTLKLWLADLIKSLVISTVITGIIVSVCLWLVQWSPNYWWIWIWGFFLIFSLFLMYISPHIIEPLFNKFSPIEEPGLEDNIKDLMRKVHIRVSRVFQMDASKRSRHTNAYFSGIGKVKRIILYDTLLKKMDRHEILAVIAHEAGHWKKRHILKMIVAAETLSLAGIYISFKLLQTDFLANLFRIQQETFFAKVIVIGFIGSIFVLPFIPLSNYISRRFEKEADRFACHLTGNKEAMASALIKLSRDNLSNLHPHPLYAAFYYSHPPVVQRIRDISGMHVPVTRSGNIP